MGSVAGTLCLPVAGQFSRGFPRWELPVPSFVHDAGYLCYTEKKNKPSNTQEPEQQHKTTARRSADLTKPNQMRTQQAHIITCVMMLDTGVLEHQHRNAAPAHSRWPAHSGGTVLGACVSFSVNMVPLQHIFNTWQCRWSWSHTADGGGGADMEVVPAAATPGK